MNKRTLKAIILMAPVSIFLVTALAIGVWQSPTTFLVLVVAILSMLSFLCGLEMLR